MTDKNNDNDPAVCHDISRPQNTFRENENFSRTPKFSVSCKQVKLLTLICPCIANTFADYNQQDATFLNLFL